MPTLEHPPDEPVEPFENDNCPESCYIDHPVDQSDGGSYVTCPATGVTYFWCGECADWYATDRYINVTEVRPGYRVCNPGEHNYYQCFECNGWVDEYSFSSDCHGTTWCDNCYPGCDCRECEPRDDDDEEQEENGDELTTCVVCNTTNVHMDAISERFLCDCAVRALFAIHPHHPIKLMRAFDLVTT